MSGLTRVVVFPPVTSDLRPGTGDVRRKAASLTGRKPCDLLSRKGPASCLRSKGSAREEDPDTCPSFTAGITPGLPVLHPVSSSSLVVVTASSPGRYRPGTAEPMPQHSYHIPCCRPVPADVSWRRIPGRKCSFIDSRPAVPDRTTYPSRGPETWKCNG